MRMISLAPTTISHAQRHTPILYKICTTNDGCTLVESNHRPFLLQDEAIESALPLQRNPGDEARTSLLNKDAFLVFRALCKLSIRTSDSATVQDPTAVRCVVVSAASAVVYYLPTPIKPSVVCLLRKRPMPC